MTLVTIRRKLQEIPHFSGALKLPFFLKIGSFTPRAMSANSRNLYLARKPAGAVPPRPFAGGAFEGWLCLLFSVTLPFCNRTWYSPLLFRGLEERT